jgi:centrosomal protein CEP72
LSLPGTYHEKVVEFGSSFRKFTRLKSLDVSRNTITCLKGMEHLKLLEKLNLYYNSIESFEELKRLRFNSCLRELDLRLNPVTRTEADYRLYLIHMLPNLQKLGMFYLSNSSIFHIWCTFYMNLFKKNTT